jgi:peroxiredoxin
MALATGGCREAGPADPTAFLRLAMQRTSALRTFQARCAYEVTTATGGASEPTMRGTRTIAYERPNRFRVVSSPGGRITMTCISDGVRLLEYSTLPGAPASTFSAPETIGKVGSMQMKHPMFCGSLLYAFLSPGATKADIVDLSKEPITFGDDVTVDGVRCRTVKFYAVGDYGHAEVSAGAEDGLVRRIRYDTEPLVKAAAAQSRGLSNMSTVETYSGIRMNQAIAASQFEAKAPAGMETQGAPAPRDEAPAPPVALGQRAPGFTVTGPDGKPVRLADFRGKVVFLDFWATWCPPCRESLPKTQKLHKRFGAKGLAVVAITNEDRATAEAFCKKNGYSFPVYTDGPGTASLAFDVYGIPTFAIVDRAGRLVSYYVGPQPPEVIARDLVKAGLVSR